MTDIYSAPTEYLHPDSALPAPVIPAAFDGGLGYDDIVRDPTAFVLVQAGPVPDLMSGDVITLYWAGEIVAILSVTTESDIISLPVPVRDIRRLGEGTVAVHYSVLYGLGGISEDSLPLSVTVKFSLPGGTDPFPDTPYVNENLTAPRVVPSPVPDSASEASVTVGAWQHQAEGDALTVHWAGFSVAQPPLAAGESGARVVTVPRDVLEAAGGGLQLPVSYSIRDRAGNWSLYAPYAYTDVEIEDPAATEAPEVAESADGITLDLGLVGDSDATVWVPRYSGYAAGDSVVVSWEGRTAAGQSLSWQSAPYVVPARPPFVFEFFVPNDRVTPLAQGSVRVRYVVDGGLPSRALTLQVTGEVQRLAAPVVPAAQDGVLDPADVPSGAVVTVPAWAGMAAGDIVSLTWSGLSATGTPVIYEAERAVSGSGAGRPLSFTVPAASVVALLNGTVKVWYTVDTYELAQANGVNAVSLLATLRSPELELEVREAGTVLLPAPSVDGVVDGALPANAPDTTVRIPAYPGQAVRDRIDVRWSGRSSFSDFLLVSRVGEQSLYVERDYIADNADGEVTVSYAVTPAGGADITQSAPYAFRIGEPAVVWPELPAPQIKELEGGELDPAAGATFVVAASAGLEENDRVTLNWLGGYLRVMQITVGAEDAGWTLEVHLPQEWVDENLNRGVTLNYFVRRGDGTLQTAKESLTLHVRDAAPPIGNLPQPSSPDVKNDQVDSRLTLFRTHIDSSAGLAKGDVVTFSVTGTSGSDSQTRTLDAAQSGDIEFIFNGGDVLEPNKGRSIAVAYTVVRGETSGTSPYLIVSVAEVSPPIGNLPQPSSPDISGGTVDATLSILRARIDRSAGLLKGDTVKFSVVGPNGNKTMTRTLDAAQTTYLEFSFDGDIVLAPNAGRNITLSYVVERGSESPTSPALTVGVVELTPPIGNLPQPSSPDISGGAVNATLSTFHTRIAQSAGLLKGDTLKFSVVGPNGNRTLSRTLDAAQTTYLEFSFPGNVVLAPNAGRNITLSYIVERGSESRTSPVLVTAVKAPPIALPLPTIPTAHRGEIIGTNDSTLKTKVILVRSASLFRGDKVTFTISGPVTSKSVTVTLDANQTGDIKGEFLNVEAVTPNMLREILVTIKVERGGITHTSPQLKLFVKPEIDYGPPPRVSGIVNGEIDSSKISAITITAPKERAGLANDHIIFEIKQSSTVVKKVTVVLDKDQDSDIFYTFSAQEVIWPYIGQRLTFSYSLMRANTGMSSGIVQAVVK